MEGGGILISASAVSHRQQGREGGRRGLEKNKTEVEEEKERNAITKKADQHRYNI